MKTLSPRRGALSESGPFVPTVAISPLWVAGPLTAQWVRRLSVGVRWALSVPLPLRRESLCSDCAGG